MLAAVWLSMGANAVAGVLTFSGTVVNAPAASLGLVAPRLFDESGLSSRYVNGETDFTQYLNSGVTHFGSSATNGTGFLGAAGAVIDIDLGKSLMLSHLALWNDNDTQGVKNFSLWAAQNANFSDAVSLGSFVAQYGDKNSLLAYSKPTKAQLFDLNDAIGRYVRVKFNDAYAGSKVNVGELVFGADEPQQVSAPGSLALTGLGLLAIVSIRRRQIQTWAV